MSPLQQRIEDAVTALTALDAQALERIRQEVQETAVVPLSSEEIAALIPACRLLGALLQQTERNLKLFRVASLVAQQASDTGCYASPLR